MNILIVDDEYYIVKNIIDNVDWASYGISQTFSAYSAAQARRILEGPDQIDIVISDIAMPKEDGFSLIRWIREKGLNPLIMILTGHQRFDYAREAINLHIFSYLLKPIAYDELNTQMENAIAEIEKKQVYNTPVPQTEPSAPSAISSFDPIGKIKQVIQQNLSNPDLNRQMLADAIHMNQDYMSHLFNSKTGSTLSSYIMEQRLNRAKELLLCTECTLGEISEQTGFSNTSYFHRQFKKATGITPQQYRESKRQTNI